MMNIQPMNSIPEGANGACCTAGCNGKPRISRKNVSADRELEAFASLSMKEREEAMEDLHGVSGFMQETPEIVEMAIQKMKVELSLMPIRKRKSLDRAIFLCPTIERDEKLMLRFLRGERFDPKKAAMKMCIHFDHKAELFPLEKLPCRITLDDLSEDDMFSFRTGTFQPLPTKDQAGRTVLVIDISKLDYKHWKNQVRWYIHY